MNDAFGGLSGRVLALEPSGLQDALLIDPRTLQPYTEEELEDIYQWKECIANAEEEQKILETQKEEIYTTIRKLERTFSKYKNDPRFLANGKLLQSKSNQN